MVAAAFLLSESCAMAGGHECVVKQSRPCPICWFTHTRPQNSPSPCILWRLSLWLTAEGVAPRLELAVGSKTDDRLASRCCSDRDAWAFCAGRQLHIT